MLEIWQSPRPGWEGVGGKMSQTEVYELGGVYLKFRKFYIKMQFPGF
jgi:hypothetical protein